MGAAWYGLLSTTILVPRGGKSTKNRDLWPTPTAEVRDSRTFRHSAHAQCQVWQIGLVLVSIYCVYKAIQNRNVVGPRQRSRFLVLTKRSAATGEENDRQQPSDWFVLSVACKLSWTLFSPARVQHLFGAERKESSGTGLTLHCIVIKRLQRMDAVPPNVFHDISNQIEWWGCKKAGI